MDIFTLTLGSALSLYYKLPGIWKYPRLAQQPVQPEGDSRCVALSRHTALLTAAFGVDKKMLPENPLKHEMKLLKFEHNKLKNTQVDDKTYYNIIHLKT